MKSKILIVLIVFALIFLFVISRNPEDKNFVTDPSINLGIGWNNYESSYSGSELNFIFNKSKKVSFSFASNSKADQGVNILIDGKSYIMQSPDLDNQKLTISVDKSKSHTATVRYFCTRFYYPCHIKISGIYFDNGAKIWPYQLHNKNLTVLGDSISTIYGKDNYTQILANDVGYELRDASIIQSTVSPVKGVDNAIYRYKKDLLSFKSDATIIFMGTNDAGNNVPLDVFERNYRKIVSELKKYNPNGKIFLVAILPRKDIDESILNNYNQVINRISQYYKTYYIDPTNWLIGSDFSDDIHPSISSQVKIANEFNKIVGPILK